MLHNPTIDSMRPCARSQAHYLCNIPSLTRIPLTYDSVECPQQKCLIHLIRDMNDDLVKEPFNEEIKQLVGEFAVLLKAIIETVDRFGLKARFLRRHKVAVDRFFKRLANRDYQTETALKCKTRLQKNRGGLFTFLDFDDVPWNNNNAEHAIKAFALLRRDFSGVATEKGIRDYLILLSICETCKCKGVSFLDFLRCGGKDIDAFAESKWKRIRAANVPIARLDRALSTEAHRGQRSKAEVARASRTSPR